MKMKTWNKRYLVLLYFRGIIQEFLEEYMRILERKVASHKDFHNSEDNRIISYIEKELQEVDEMSEEEVCLKYNVDNKEEARQFIRDYWHIVA